MDFNKLIFTGNCVRDAELIVGKSGTAICKFALANTPRYQKNGEWVDGNTCFLDFVLFGEKAEAAAERIRKGCKVTVEGSIQQETWQDKTDGKNRSRHSARVDRYHIDKPAKTEEAAEPEGELAAVGAEDESFYQ